MISKLKLLESWRVGGTLTCREGRYEVRVRWYLLPMGRWRRMNLAKRCAKCCLAPAPWLEKSSFCSPFPGEMAQEKVHALITLRVPGWASTREGSRLRRRWGCARLRHACRGEAIPILDVSEARPRGSETTPTASSIQQFTAQLCLLMLPLAVLGLILSIPLDKAPCAPGV